MQTLEVLKTCILWPCLWNFTVLLIISLPSVSCSLRFCFSHFCEWLCVGHGWVRNFCDWKCMNSKSCQLSCFLSPVKLNVYDSWVANFLFLVACLCSWLGLHLTWTSATTSSKFSTCCSTIDRPIVVNVCGSGYQSSHVRLIVEEMVLFC